MFLGQYRHNIDEKGRLTIPARFRDLLANGAFVTQGFDHNLRLLTEEAFTSLYQKLSQLNTADSTTRELRRLLFANASQVEIDRIGRILVPQFLRDTAGLSSGAVIVGVGDSIEIWSPESWDKQTLQFEDLESDPQRFADIDLSL
jgi:MraZ protein